MLAREPIAPRGVNPARPHAWRTSHGRFEESRTMKALRFLRTWSLLSIPLGLFVAQFIKAGKGPPIRDDNRSADRP
jgi:hypothetical protein